jgi:hypothetical protein
MAYVFFASKYQQRFLISRGSYLASPNTGTTLKNKYHAQYCLQNRPNLFATGLMNQ